MEKQIIENMEDMRSVLIEYYKSFGLPAIKKAGIIGESPLRGVLKYCQQRQEIEKMEVGNGK